MKSDIRVFFANLSRIFKLVKVWQEQRILYNKTNIYFWSYLIQFVLDWDTFQKKFVKEM